jgi:hypothetical protein
LVPVPTTTQLTTTTTTNIPQKVASLDPIHGEVWSIEYSYSPTSSVRRKEWIELNKPKGRSKSTIPYHLGEDGEWHQGKGDKPWPAYRIDEVCQLGKGKWAIGYEGENKVECSRWLGLVAWTVQGSDWNLEFLTSVMLQMKTAGLAGTFFWPDHDKTGRKKAALVEQAATAAQFPCIILDPLAIWENIPESGDIVDWVKWGLKQGMDRDEFIQRLEEEIHKAVAARIEEQGANDPDERLKLELKALLSETDPIKRMRRRAEIASHYRLKTSDIEQALKYLDERSKTSKPRRMGLDELFDLPQTGAEYVIPGMLPVGETALLVADPKAGKSLLAYDAAFAIATGESHFLGEPTKQGKVLIIQCDESISTARGRLLKRGFRHEDKGNVQFVDSFNITQLDLLEEWLESFRPTLVIVDSLRRISAGRELSENSAEFADAVYQLKELITRYNAAGILIHHSSKNQEAVGVGRVRGSSAIAGAVWGVWQLDHIPKPDPNNKKRLIIDPKDPTRILSIIARDTEGQRLRIELDPENNHWLNLGEDGVEESELQERKTNATRIVELLKRVSPVGLEAREINDELNIGRGIYSVLNRLLGQRIIGSRPSTKDRRRTVYYYPKNGGDSPPPTPTEPDVIEYAESVAESSIQSSITIDHKSITNRSLDLECEGAEQASAQDISGVSEFDHKFETLGGSECPVTEVITSELAQSPTTEGEKLAQAPGADELKPGEKVRYISKNPEFQKYKRVTMTVVGLATKSQGDPAYDMITCRLPGGATNDFLRNTLSVLE